MNLKFSILAIVSAVVGGCASNPLPTDHGDVGQFILQHTISYGGNPATTNGLPVVDSRWWYLVDSNGLQIHAATNAYPDIEAFLNKAFADKPQFGPAGSPENRTRLHAYGLSTNGGAVQLSEQSSDTIILVLRPRGAAE